MVTQLKEFTQFIPVLAMVITFVVGYITLKVGSKAKLDEHGRNIINLDNRITHLDNFKQSTSVCNMFQKEMHDDIRTITENTKTIQEASVKTQISIAKIEGTLNGKNTK